MKINFIDIHKFCRIQIKFFLVVLIILIFISCDKSKPLDPNLPELTDVIPYEKLESGVIVFKRIGSDSGEYTGCYIIDVDQHKSWPLALPTSTYTPDNCCVSPDGKKIAFTMYSGIETAYDIYIVDINGKNLTKFSDYEWQDRFPSWSPDGNKIFFWLKGINSSALYAKSALSGENELQMIHDFKIQYEDESYIFLEPSGMVAVSSSDKIAYVCNDYRSKDLAGLYIMEGDGTNFTRIVPLDYNRDFESPIFYSDGQKIVYLSILRDSGLGYQKVDIMQVDLESTQPSLIASLSANGNKEWDDVGKKNSVYLACSPDGNKFLINIPEDDFVSHLYLINSDGRNLTQVSFAGGATDRCVSWGR